MQLNKSPKFEKSNEWIGNSWKAMVFELTQMGYVDGKWWRRQGNW